MQTTTKQAATEIRRTFKDIRQEATIARIASEILGLDTLVARKSDRLDFSEQHVDVLRKALEAAYEAGRLGK